MRWCRAMFKGRKVWAAVAPSGALDVEGGRVPIRYSDAAGARVYQAGASRVVLLDSSAASLPEGRAASERSEGSSAREGRGSGFGSAKTRSKQQAVAAAEAAASLVANLPEGTAVAYTDGGCKGNPGPAGSGVWLSLPDGRSVASARSLGRGTNNVAELTALDMTLSLLDEAGWPPDEPVAVLTDSRYAKGVLVDGWKAKANRELILSLRKRLAARPGVALHWVAGHAGVAGNEKADSLAGEGIVGRSYTEWSGE